MCIQYYRRYTCGDKRKEDFHQCEKRRGTNVRCTPLEEKFYEESAHYCVDHIVSSEINEKMKRIPPKKEKS
jgi:hypothetical protein